MDAALMSLERSAGSAYCKSIMGGSALLIGLSLLPTAMPSHGKDTSVSAATESAAASALDPRGAVTAEDITKELASAATAPTKRRSRKETR